MHNLLGLGGYNNIAESTGTVGLQYCVILLAQGGYNNMAESNGTGGCIIISRNVLGQGGLQ